MKGRVEIERETIVVVIVALQCKSPSLSRLNARRCHCPRPIRLISLPSPPPLNSRYIFDQLVQLISLARLFVFARDEARQRYTPAFGILRGLAGRSVSPSWLSRPNDRARRASTAIFLSL